MLRRAAPLALAVALLVATSAQARIVPFEGVGKARLGMTRAQLLKKLGRPVRTSGAELAFGRGLRVRLIDGRAAVVATTNAGQRTRAGVGPRVSARVLRRAYPRAQCFRETAAQVGRGCYLVRRTRGRTVATRFAVAYGRVIDVTVFHCPPPAASARPCERPDLPRAPAAPPNGAQATDPPTLDTVVPFTAAETAALELTFLKSLFCGEEVPCAGTERWSFGDGATFGPRPLSREPVVHRYAAPGDYTVTLTVTLPDGRAFPFTDEVTVVGEAG